MRFRILRAATEVGGNCIQVESQGFSILLDLGLPLAAATPRVSLLPLVPGLERGDNEALLGIIISHPHQDHYGLLASASPSIPVYIGEDARNLLEAAAFFTRGAAIRQPITSYRNGQPFDVGPFTVTPMLVDHSAYDAHALLVEADGKRLVYSGDFRAHGRKSVVMEQLFTGPPCAVDVLLLEGTTLGRAEGEQPSTEDELEGQVAAALDRCGGLALAYFSAQNIDRLVTFNRAAAIAGRALIVDAYTACIIDRLKPVGIPAILSGSIRVYLPKRQKLQIVRGRRFDLVEPFRSQRIYAPEIVAEPHRWVMLFRGSMIEDAESLGCLDGGLLIYSLWPGYLDRDAFDLREWAKKWGLGFDVRHTSGHAYLKDLRRFVNHFAPKRLVPIHTSRPQRYPSLFENVEIVPGGKWCDI